MMLVPVILSGGNGSRLWPVSRETHPKAFIRLNNSLSLLQTTYQRAASIPNVEHILTVTNKDYYYQSKVELQQLSKRYTKKKFSFLLEPIARNTAPAIALSSLLVQKLISPNTIILVLAVDHIIINQNKFNDCVTQAYQLAQQGLLVTFGIIPNRVETGYGYIQYTHSIGNDVAYQVSNFHEKPSIEKAQFFIEQGNYLWNSGIFCFSANALLQTLEKHNPEFYRKILDCWELSQACRFFHDQVDDKLNLDKNSFYAADNISIDYALMEKAKNLAVIPANFGWSDIGSWDVLDNLLQADEDGNRVSSNAVLQESTNTTIYSQALSKNRLIAALGLKNLIIVDTPDALLILDRSHAQNVKHVVEKIKQDKLEAYQYHQTVYRPWGSYTLIEQGENYKLKRITVNPNSNLSLQMHHHRSEYWVVIQGVATVQNNEAHFTLHEQESTFILKGHKHRLSNFTTKPLVIIELQLGLYLGEDDIIRFADDYDREDSTYVEQANTF